MSTWAASYENQLADERGEKGDDLAKETANLAVGDNAGGFNAAANGNRGGFGFSNKASNPSFGFGCARPGGFGSGFGPGANNADEEEKQVSPTKMGGQRNPFGRPQQQSPFAPQPQPAFGQMNGGQPRQQQQSPFAPQQQQQAFGQQRPPQNAFGGQKSPFVQTGAMRGGHQPSPRFHQTQQTPPQALQQQYQAQTQLPARRSPIEEAGEKPMNPEDVALLNKFLHRTVKLMQDGKVDVHAQQRDPKSPLHSVLVFKELRLKEELLRALDLMGYHQPSKIQEFALPLLLMEPPTNMIAQSQSGTGKTAAFVLTMLSRVVPENQWPQCICLAPTYELAMQIGEVVNKMGRFLPEVKVHYAVRGTAKLPPGTMLKEQIIIGTPGRMIDYITKMRCFDATKIACLVLDEADVMIGQQGHLDLSHRIYNAIEAKAPSVQTMLFSATYDQAVMEFAEKLIKDAVSVTLKREDLTLNNIKQFYVECRDREAKYQAVCDLYSGLILASSVVFTRTRSSASWLAAKLREKGHEVALLHGDMTVQERAKSIEQFKDGVYKVLITTNVCSRGIDVSQVSIVINYDLPYYVERPDEPDYETYLHRIGRTGRFGKAGIAINFVDSIEDLQLVQKLDNHFSRRIPKLDPANIDELEAIEKEDF